jgi:uncharacterized delta-60 repeat protein
MREVINFSIANNTNATVPVSLFGNKADQMDTANATTQYSWNLTSLTITNETQVLIEFRGVNESTFVSSSATFSGTSLQNVVNALNTLNLGYFFITTSGGNSFLNNYNQNIIFRNLNVYAPSLINPAFFQGTGFDNDALYSKVSFYDNSILTVGNFTSYNGTNANRIIRLNSDGSVDTSFNFGTGFNSFAYTIATQLNNTYIIGGDFTSYNGTARNRIIGLKQDGSIDTSFNVGTGFNNTPLAIAVQNDGKVIIGGDFTSYNGNARNRIIRLNSNGSIDTSFIIGAGFNGSVNSIYVQNDGKVLVVGNYSAYGATFVGGIIRLNSNGSIDTSFNNGGVGFNSSVQTVTVDSIGRILVGGIFTDYNGTTTSGIVRLNSNGSVETAAPIGFGGYLWNIEVQINGKILATGLFVYYNNITSTSIIRLNNDFSIDTSWNCGTGLVNITPATGYKLAINNNQTSVFLVGTFNEFDGTPQGFISNLLI